MAITIRNKETERIIREIGRKTGEGPSAVIRRAVESLREPERKETEDERIARRMRAWEELNKEFPPPDDKRPWSEVEREMDALFDYLYEEDKSAESGH